MFLITEMENSTIGDFYSSTTNATRDVSSSKELIRLCYAVRLHFLIVFAVVGFIGNTFSFVIFYKSKARNTSIRVYLITLSFADSFVLILEVLVRSPSVNTTYGELCTGLFYLRNTIKIFEAFLVITLCVERMLMLCYPIIYRKMSKPVNSILFIIVNLVLSALLSIHIIFTIKLIKHKHGKHECNVPVNMEHEYIITDGVFTGLIGEVTVSIVLIAVTVKVKHSLNQMRTVSRNISESVESSVNFISTVITRVTVTIAVTFVVFRNSYSVVYLIFFIYRMKHKHDQDVYLENLSIAVAFFSLVSNLNYCTNVLIYVLCWPSFKQSSKSLLSCTKTVYRSANSNDNIIRLRHLNAIPDPFV